jgi:ribulose-5-phosphate 4-epimerase/fuculose-1-phosphate aldolase
VNRDDDSRAHLLASHLDRPGVRWADHTHPALTRVADAAVRLTVLRTRPTQYYPDDAYIAYMRPRDPDSLHIRPDRVIRRDPWLVRTID